MSTLARYLVLQLPGWVLAALLLGALVRFGHLEPALALALFGLWLLKDFALFPLLRVGYERRKASPGDGLVGARGVAQETLDPSGYVRVGPELWRAALPPGATPLPAGSPVRVLGLEGLTLRVAPEVESQGGPA